MEMAVEAMAEVVTDVEVTDAEEVKHYVLGDLDVGAGPGHDLGGEERLGHPTVPRDNPQPAEEQINKGVIAGNLRLSIFRRGQFFLSNFVNTF